MKTFEQLRQDIMQGVEAARAYAADVKYASPMMEGALLRIAAEAEKAAEHALQKEVLLVAIGRLAGAISVAAAYQRGRGA
jgi:hypothetical protein